MENFNENQSQQPQLPQESPQYRQEAQAQPQPQRAPYPTGFQAAKPTLPNATASLVLGILSIVTSCWFVGFVLGIIGLVLGNKARRIYLLAPEAYNGYGMANAGRITSIVGICIGSLYVLYIFVLIGLIGIGLGLSEGADWIQHFKSI